MNWDNETTREPVSNEDLAWMLDLPVETVDQFFGKLEYDTVQAEQVRDAKREAGENV